MMDFAAARKKMVDSQLRTEDVTDHAVLTAMADVPRELFVPPEWQSLAYIDEDVPLTRTSAASPVRYLMAPAPLGRLLQLAEISPSESVLDIGCATGYAAAVLARIAKSVVALEVDSGLADAAAASVRDLGIGNVTVARGPLEQGHPSAGPYDVILVEGAVEVVPDALFGQLAENGRLVAVVGLGRSALAMVYTKTDGDMGGRSAFDAYVPPLPGFKKPEMFVF
jgi:protein-L-isoaspartate(D-aspartate) O-methyltransferase